MPPFQFSYPAYSLFAREKAGYNYGHLTLVEKRATLYRRLSTLEKELDWVRVERRDRRLVLQPHKHHE